jgi:hypothetical protein
MLPTVADPRARSVQEEISRRAYEIYLAEGCPEGRAMQHWLMAEMLLTGESTSKTPSAARRSVGSRKSHASAGRTA